MLPAAMMHCSAIKSSSFALLLDKRCDGRGYVVEFSKLPAATGIYPLAIFAHSGVIFTGQHAPVHRRPNPDAMQEAASQKRHFDGAYMMIGAKDLVSPVWLSCAELEVNGQPSDQSDDSFPLSSLQNRSTGQPCIIRCIIHGPVSRDEQCHLDAHDIQSCRHPTTQTVKAAVILDVMYVRQNSSFITTGIMLVTTRRHCGLKKLYVTTDDTFILSA